jgi:hypothetical protein
MFDAVVNGVPFLNAPAEPALGVDVVSGTLYVNPNGQWQSAMNPSQAIVSATPATQRVIAGSAVLSAGSISVSGGSGSIVGTRGDVTLGASSTVTAGFLYGVQGKLIPNGTLANGSGFNAGIFGQVDTSAATFVHTSGYLAPIMGDFGATSIMATDVNANMVSLLNTTNCLINAGIQFTGNASYAFDFSDLAYGGKHFITTGASGGSNTKCLIVHIDGSPMKIQLFA